MTVFWVGGLVIAKIMCALKRADCVIASNSRFLTRLEKAAGSE